MKGNSNVGLLAVFILILGIGMILVKPYFEMKTFNKFSDKKATYLDAVFSDLRIVSK